MIDQRRAKNVAIAGAFLQVALAAVCLGIWLAVGSRSAFSTMLFLAGGLAVWLMAVILSYCKQLAEAEAKELAEITASGAAGTTIFEGELSLAPARSRLTWMEKWIVPIFTLLWAGYHALIGIIVFRSFWTHEPIALSSGAAQATLFALLAAFAGFLFSRYALGMGSQVEWRLLRAAGSYLFLNVLAIAAVATAMLAAYQNYVYLDTAVSLIVPAVCVVLAVELALNFILDLYRPRMPGQEHRYSFDSRLCNFIAEPGRIGHSIAEALNYQFGFEVSKTWFYQLISRAFVPLVVLGAAVLVGMTSIVTVDQGEQAVVLHWGRIDKDRGNLGAGLHFKWPWPIDSVQIFDVAAMHEIELGVGRARTEEERRTALVKEGTFKGRELNLWTEEHGAREELDFLLAIPPERTRATSVEEQRPPVNIIKLVAAVHYVITDAIKYGFQVADVEKLLEMEAYRQMVTYCACATLDSPISGGAADRPEAIMTYGRLRAAEELKKRIQAAADRLDLGVKIVYVGLPAVHPPVGAAGAFEDVLKAERKQDQLRYQAEAEANGLLAKMAGDPTAALRLSLAIRTLEQLERLNTLRNNAAELKKALDEYIRVAKDDLKAMDEEIAREQLLGQKATAKQQLRKDQQAHLELLSDLAKQGVKADFAGHVPLARLAADRLFDQATGEPATLVAAAWASRWSRELSERARAEGFARQLQAYQASPNIYMLDRWLDVWDEVLPGIDKYVLGVDRKYIQVWLNLERTGSLMEGAFESQSGKK